MNILKVALTGTGITVGTPIAAFVAISKNNLDVPWDQYNPAGADASVMARDKVYSNLFKEIDLVVADADKNLEYKVTESEINRMIYQDTLLPMTDDATTFDSEGEAINVDGNGNLNLYGNWVELKKDQIIFSTGIGFKADDKEFKTQVSLHLGIKAKAKGDYYEFQIKQVDLGDLVLPANVLGTMLDNLATFFGDGMDVEAEINKNVGAGEFQLKKMKYKVAKADLGKFASEQDDAFGTLLALLLEEEMFGFEVKKDEMVFELATSKLATSDNNKISFNYCDTTVDTDYVYDATIPEDERTEANSCSEPLTDTANNYASLSVEALENVDQDAEGQAILNSLLFNRITDNDSATITSEQFNALINKGAEDARQAAKIAVTTKENNVETTKQYGFGLDGVVMDFTDGGANADEISIRTVFNIGGLQIQLKGEGAIANDPEGNGFFIDFTYLGFGADENDDNLQITGEDFVKLINNDTFQKVPGERSKVLVSYEALSTSLFGDGAEVNSIDVNSNGDVEFGFVIPEEQAGDMDAVNEAVKDTLNSNEDKTAIKDAIEVNPEWTGDEATAVSDFENKLDTVDTTDANSVEELRLSIEELPDDARNAVYDEFFNQTKENATDIDFEKLFGGNAGGDEPTEGTVE